MQQNNILLSLIENKTKKLNEIASKKQRTVFYVIFKDSCCEMNLQLFTLLVNLPQQLLKLFSRAFWRWDLKKFVGL